MTKDRTDNSEKLQKLLRELFQFDAADLDFGIYRILNQRRERIEKFIEHDLLEAVQEGLASLEAAEAEEIQSRMDDIRSQLGGSAFDDEGAVLEKHRDLGIAREYMSLRQQLQQLEVAEETETRVFNDLHRFFARYYDQGDFLTERRYSSRDPKYAIPYNGEEVLLHWANRDQYYVKSSERFADYRFRVDGTAVWFKLEEAQEPTDNVKSQDRYFVLRDRDPLEVEEEGGLLVVHMEYRSLSEEEHDRYLKRYNEQQSKSARRKTLNRSAVVDALEVEILEELESAELKGALARPRGGAASSDRSELGYHLNRFTARNTMDYFVHKDLGGFLRRELDYYLKAEILQVGDVLGSPSGDALQAALRRTRVVRDIAEKVITFLAKIEDFQKRLFEKKKFVVQTDYCITLDRVPEEFYEEILANESQSDEWRSLYGIDEWSKDLFWQGNYDHDFINNNPYLMIDTALYSTEFKRRLISSINAIDDGIGGVLLKSENFQALALLQLRYGDAADCIYIDPPYNTAGHSEILYKNDYKDSSWLSLMENRLVLSESFMGDQAVLVIAIDDYEMPHLCELVDRLYPGHERHMVVVNHHPQGGGGDNVSRTHEYALFLVPEGLDILRGQKADAGVEYRPFMRSGSGENNFRYGRPNSFYAILVDPETFEVKGAEPPPELEEEYPKGLTAEGYLRVYPLGGDGSERVWRLSYESGKQAAERGGIICRESQTVYQVIDNEDRRAPLFSNWTDKRYNAGTHGTNLIAALFGTARVFSYPKSLYTVRDSIESVTHDRESAMIVDYFAGSGTTAHAVLDLDREEGGNRRYLLVEVGEYFDTVLKPRIQKVVFSQRWKDGKPQDSSGISHMFKYQRLESYEDALNNIELTTPEEDQATFLYEETDDYLLGYMLDFEAKESASLLREDAFARPFDYKLMIQNGMESPQPTKVDLVETFHYLIGMHVRRLQFLEHQDRDYAISRGEVRTDQGNEQVVVVWRRTTDPDLDLEKEAEWFNSEVMTEPVDRVYVNSESYIRGAEPLGRIFRERMEGRSHRG